MKNFIFALTIFFGSITNIWSLEKWIVITSIQQPTEQIQALSKTPDWHIIVVGDKKTPPNWNLDNCTYLSPMEQLNLGFELASLLPWNHYSRKNLGYLYAIAHGADLIYETDDDNEPLETLNPLERFSVLPSISAPQSVVNIYAYFGRPDLWPRGYPLERFSPLENLEINQETNCHIGIEQGIVNGDPDVDAIYRLTQGKDVFFKNYKSCFLAPGIFCPFNSQNTYFHREAFITLYLPSSVTMRVADIWRGYVAQRLIWDMGLVLAFSGPNAFQKRNSHLLLKDFIDEYDLYTKSGLLIDFLKNWKPSSSESSLEDLTDSLVESQFFKPEESTLVRAWIRDLKKAEDLRIEYSLSR